MSDTTELRDWHARRAGWTMHNGQWRREHRERREYEYAKGHPFPPTLDAADASFPPGWDWEKTIPLRMADGSHWYACRYEPNGMSVQMKATGDKIHDLYALSKLAWEQEQALAAACKEVGGNGN